MDDDQLQQHISDVDGYEDVEDRWLADQAAFEEQRFIDSMLPVYLEYVEECGLDAVNPTDFDEWLEDEMDRQLGDWERRNEW